MPYSFICVISFLFFISSLSVIHMNVCVYDTHTQYNIQWRSQNIHKQINIFWPMNVHKEARFFSSNNEMNQIKRDTNVQELIILYIEWACNFDAMSQNRSYVLYTYNTHIYYYYFYYCYELFLLYQLIITFIKHVFQMINIISY